MDKFFAAASPTTAVNHEGKWSRRFRFGLPEIYHVAAVFAVLDACLCRNGDGLFVFPGLLGRLFCLRFLDRDLQFPLSLVKEPCSVASAIDVPKFFASSFDSLHQRCDDVRVLLCKVSCFARISGQIKELRYVNRVNHAAPPASARRILAARQNQFPLSAANARQQAACVIKVLIARTALRLIREKLDCVLAIDLCLGQFSVGDRCEGGQQVHRAEDFVRIPTGGNLVRPTSDKGDSATTVPRGHLPTSKRFHIARMIARNEFLCVGIHGASGFDPRAVVGCEDDKRIVVDVEFFQGLENFAARPVYFFDRVTVKTTRRFAFEFL